MDPRERWGSADFTHTLSQVNWMASTAVLMHLNERSTGDPARDWLSAWAHRYFTGDRLRVLVLGCGEGWLERAIAAWPFVERIDATDIAPDAVERARAQAGPKQHYSVLDLNRDAIAPGTYDVVVAHSILHHVENLEHAYDQIERALKPEGTLLVNEYAGPNRFQFDDHVLRLINELRDALGAPRMERPSAAFMIEHDPSEAVRSEDVLPLLRNRFEVLEEKALGGTILMHLLYNIVQNFRFDDPVERSLIDLLCTFEGALVDRGAVGSDFVLAAARRKSARASRASFSRPLPPRPEAARDIDPDPLTLRGRAGSARGGALRLLQPWHMRMLRIVLASTQSRRANLFHENRLHALREQIAFALHGGDATAWILARAEVRGIDPRVRSLLLRIGELT